MSANSFGSRFTVTSFGESHGPAMGVLIDGCPAGVSFYPELLSHELKRRRPGVHTMTSAGKPVLGMPKEGDLAAAEQIVSGRMEKDEPEILSGVFEGKTLGTPIAILVRNQDARSEDYDRIKAAPRTGHADDVWRAKFAHSDHRGGGRSSGRETVSRVMAGAVAQMLVKQLHPELRLVGYASQIGSFVLSSEERSQILDQKVDSFQARFPSARHEQVAASLREAQAAGESYGGVAEILLHKVPANLGQPVFHKFKADLAQAFLSVGATNGFELGMGFEAASEKGTIFHQEEPSNATKNYGGIRGGISTGDDIILRVSFKPTSSILDVAKKGRHDPCIVTRAIPVLEAMTWIVLADHILWSRTDQI